MNIAPPFFAAVNKMCGAMVAGEYPHITLVLLFLHDVSEPLARQHELIAEGGGVPEDRDKYMAEPPPFLLPSARSSSLAAQSMDARIGVVIDDAMCEIKAKNSSLKDARRRVFGCERIDRALQPGMRRKGLSAATANARAAAVMLGRQRQAGEGYSLG